MVDLFFMSESNWLLLNHVDVQVSEDTEKAEVLNAIFASVFTAELSPQESQISEVREG